MKNFSIIATLAFTVATGIFVTGWVCGDRYCPLKKPKPESRVLLVRITSDGEVSLPTDYLPINETIAGIIAGYGWQSRVDGMTREEAEEFARDVFRRMLEKHTQ